LEVAAMSTQAEIATICDLCGGPHENQKCYLMMQDQPLEKGNYIENQQQQQPYEDLNSKVPRTTISKTIHLTNHFSHHLFHNQLPYHLHLNLNYLKLILRQPWKNLP
ncbi:hypothetical protein PIB30_107835, partial [Stylosanthes scabra]|nr:hypothetical protein [Stylosanthes scabra]